MYRLANTIAYRDIVSESRYKVYTMPAVCKLRCLTSCTVTFNPESRRTAVQNVLDSYVLELVCKYNLYAYVVVGCVNYIKVNPYG